MSTLYSLTSEYLQLLDMMQDPDVDPQTVADTIEGIEGEIEIKADNLITVCKELEAQAAKWKAEKTRAERNQSTAENGIKRIKESILATMQITGRDKLPTEHYKLSIAKNGGLAPIVLNGPVPMEYCKHEPDNAKIRELLKGGPVEWAELGERGVHLGIR